MSLQAKCLYMHNVILFSVAPLRTIRVASGVFPLLISSIDISSRLNCRYPPQLSRRKAKHRRSSISLDRNMPSAMINIAYIHSSVFVSVYICDEIKHQRKHIADVPLSLLKCFAPDVLHLVEFDAQHGNIILLLRMQYLEHANDIEVPALTHLITHWRTNTPLVHSSIGDTVLYYRALQLLLNPQAEEIRSIIMRRLRTKPVDEVDVQIIWWTLIATAESHEWLDALLYNLVRFKVLKKEPTGGYIELFVETELLRLNEKAYERVVSLYHKHQSALKNGTKARLSRFLRGTVRRAFRISL